MWSIYVDSTVRAADTKKEPVTKYAVEDALRTVCRRM